MLLVLFKDCNVGSDFDEDVDSDEEENDETRIHIITIQKMKINVMMTTKKINRIQKNFMNGVCRLELLIQLLTNILCHSTMYD